MEQLGSDDWNQQKSGRYQKESFFMTLLRNKELWLLHDGLYCSKSLKKFIRFTMFIVKSIHIIIIHTIIFSSTQDLLIFFLSKTKKCHSAPFSTGSYLETVTDQNMSFIAAIWKSAATFYWKVDLPYWGTQWSYSDLTGKHLSKDVC